MQRPTAYYNPGACAPQPNVMSLLLGADLFAPASLAQTATTTTPRPVRCPTCAIEPDLQREVASFVASLPCQQRTALMLRLRQRLDYAEIAATLGCDEREARSTVYEAVHSIRAHLGDRL